MTVGQRVVSYSIFCFFWSSRQGSFAFTAKEDLKDAEIAFQLHCVQKSDKNLNGAIALLHSGEFGRLFVWIIFS